MVVVLETWRIVPIPFNHSQGLPGAPMEYKMLHEAYPGSTLFTFPRQINRFK